MKKYFTKPVCVLLIFPPIFIAFVIYFYEISKGDKNSNYLRTEVEYDRPNISRVPATTNKQKQEKLLHEAFSR